MPSEDAALSLDRLAIDVETLEAHGEISAAKRVRAALALIARLTAERDAARECLRFFASVIKSGEAWTPTCEAAFRAALAPAPAEGKPE